jgi:hypothetical protein
MKTSMPIIPFYCLYGARDIEQLMYHILVVKETSHKYFSSQGPKLNQVCDGLF